MNLFKKQSHLTEFQVSEYLDAISTDNIKSIDRRIKKHIAECDSCRNQIIEVYTFIQSNNNESSQINPVTVKLPKRIKLSNQLRYGLVAVIGVIMIPLALVISNQNVIDSSLLTPLPAMEFLVNQQFRAEAISIKSPVNDGWKENPITFSWSGHATMQLYVSIVNNAGETILSQPATDCSHTLNQDLSPGLYYWKLESDNDLVHVGKFLVK